jgi:hypothetical protein
LSFQYIGRKQMNYHAGGTKTLTMASLLIFALALGIANADILPVPSNDYPTIQAALDDAFSGDQILVEAGEYQEHLTITTRVELAGAGQDKTTIVGADDKTPVVIINSPRVGATIKDLTVKGGSVGIQFQSSPGDITDVTITETGSNGIECSSSSPTITRVTITNTKANGIWTSASSPFIDSVVITDAGQNGISCEGNGAAPKIRRAIIMRSEKSGVYRDSWVAPPDLGTTADPGHNEIRRNREFNIRSVCNYRDTVSAIGNWWGADPPDASLIRSNRDTISYDPWLAGPPGSTQPTISIVEPNAGEIAGGTLIRIKGNNFVDEATVTIGGNLATNVSVDSNTELTAITPAGAAGPADVAVTNPDGTKASKALAFVYINTGTPADIFQAEVTLTKGVNIFSLPLRPDAAVTASKLATDLGATIVIQAVEGNFQAYVHEGKQGGDFTLEAGKGVIVNLLEKTTYSLKGRAWGTAIPAAPMSPIAAPWAFVVAGRIDGTIPADVQLSITNRRTGEKRIVPISASGEFTAAFVDMSKQSVVVAGDELVTQLFGANGVPLMKGKRHLILDEHLTRAYLLTRFSAMPKRTSLLQNYPNPFNPETWIPYTLAEQHTVTMRIYDINGREVKAFSIGHQPAGWYHTRESAVHWDGRNTAGEYVSSGVYWVVMETETSKDIKKLVILK